MSFTLDQLSYILERKFNNLIVGQDALIGCTVEGPTDRGLYVPNKDACIHQWNVTNFPQPTTEDLDKWWGVLEDQYESDPERPDSAMFKLIHGENTNALPSITMNEDI